MKIILFDIDGVLIRLPHFFSIELEKHGFKNAEESLNSFFTGKDNHQCLEGKANAEDLILPYLQKFGWQKTAIEYLKQQFQFEKQFLDKDLISIVQKLQKQGIKCCLSTDQEKNRAQFLLNDMNFKNIFDKHFISCYVGYRKCHDEFWSYTIKELKKEFGKINPNEIVFFDDKQNNIDIALKSGIQAFLFTDVTQFKKDLIKILSEGRFDSIYTK